MVGVTGFSRLRKSMYLQHVVHWLPAIIASLAIISLAHVAVFADEPPTGSELTNYINNGGYIKAGSVSQRGYTQVYYEYQGNYFYITEESNNHQNVVSAGRFIAWERVVDGRSQIVLYDVVTRASRIIVSSGTNTKPSLDQFGNIAWERWDGHLWQVHYFDYDTNQIKTVTDSDSLSNIRPDVLGDSVVYAHKDSSGTWSAFLYNASTQQTEVLASGSGYEAGWPQFKQDSSITVDKPSYSSIVQPF